MTFAQPHRPLLKRLGYDFFRTLFRWTAVVYLRLRCTGGEREPVAGGALVCSNHQSNLDPILVGVAFRRRMNYLARKTLFGFPPFGRFIAFLDAIPIDRDGIGIAGIKETLKRLRRGEMVMLFPEGTRTPDGEMQSLKPGFLALARRGRVPIVPVGIDGAFEAWPRNGRFPRPKPVQVCIGELIQLELVDSLSDDELVAEVARRIRESVAQARLSRSR